MSSILIAGSGAMACLFAARLSAAGIQVSVLDEWKEGLQALEAHGVRLVNPDGTTSSFTVQVVRMTSNCIPSTEGPSPPEAVLPQVALVLVKSWQTDRTAHLLSGCLADDGLAITLQNGLRNREALQAVLGEQRVILGVTTLGATLLEPGVVRPGGNGKIVLAKQPFDKKVITSEAIESSPGQIATVACGREHSAVLPRNDNDAAQPDDADMGNSVSLASILTIAVSGMLSSAGFQVEFSDQPEALLWGKLVVNAAINPITALLNIPNGEILDRETARQVMAAAAREAAEVARTRGIQLPFADPVAEAEKVARQTATNRSSMLQDILRGAPTEIEAICGAIVREGEGLGIPTPVNWTLFNLIKAKINENDRNPARIAQ
jgi:2-dehydropantoate 2-reductase